MIQLTALKNTRWFDPSKINHLGKVEDRRRGDLTIKLLASYTNMNQALAVLTEVKRLGFPTAFIVQDVNGQLQRVQR